MANDDFHPADDMAKAFQGLFNGDNIKQAMRDAWDRMKGNTPAAAKPAEAPPTMNWTPTANAEQQKALDANAAARIRAKAGKMAKAILLAVALGCAASVQAQVRTIQVTIGAAITQVSTTAVNCQWVVFQNNAAHSVRLGDSHTTSAIGMLLASGTPGGSFYQGPIPNAGSTNLQQFYLVGTQNDVIDVVCNVL